MTAIALRRRADRSGNAHGVLRFVGRRLVMLVVALVVSSFVIFISLDLAPGDPLSVLTGGRSLPPAALNALRHQYHLNDPLLTRYWDYITGVVLHGNLGTSIAFREPVSALISQRIAVTAELVLYSAVLIVVFGVGLGVLAGLRRGFVDSTIIAVSTLLAAIPSFVAAIVLLSVFAVKLGWLPALGNGSGFGGTIEHLTLPAIALAASAFAVVVRVTRVTVRSELEREHVQTATSRGIPRRLVIRRHVLRNASIPITTVVGITITSLFALSAVVEQAFTLNGIGAALVQAAQSKDFAVVQGISLLLVAAFVIANALVDLLYAVLDPRVAMGSRAA
ncbi:MAG TPA: ABC transporter permease [Solirubrobacteraceae bacterium]